MVVKICETCGNQFEGATKSKYCSTRCKSRKYREKKKEVTPEGIRKKAESGYKGIIADDAKAKELGVSYGVYKAMLREGVG